MKFYILLTQHKDARSTAATRPTHVITASFYTLIDDVMVQTIAQMDLMKHRKRPIELRFRHFCRKNSGPKCSATLFIPAAAKTSGSTINMHVIPSTIGSLKCGMVAWLTKHLTQNTDDFCISDKEVSKIFHSLNYYFVRMGHR